MKLIILIIIISNNKEGTCLLIDIAIPSDRNTSLKVTAKLSKYKDLETEISNMWEMKKETLSGVIAAQGLIKKASTSTPTKLQGTSM